LNFLDEASLITASSSDNLNIAPGLVALAAQIAISIISLKNPDHKYKNSLATLGPVIPLLVLDYFINNSVSNNSLSYLMSNFFSVGVEMSSIKIAEARAAAEASAPIANERSELHGGGLGAAAASSSGLGGAPEVEEVKSDAAALLSASKILMKNIDTKTSAFLPNINESNYQETKNQVLKNMDTAIAIQNLPETFKKELEKIKKELNNENHNIIDQSIIDQNFRSKMYNEYFLHKQMCDGNNFHLNMIDFEKVIQALKNLAPPNASDTTVAKGLGTVEEGPSTISV
jgi:gas vesicle protein